VSLRTPLAFARECLVTRASNRLIE